MTLLPTKPNQTRPTQATSQPRKGKGLNAHPHVTKIYKTLTFIACGVVFGLHETKIQAGEKKANIYKEEGGEIPSGLQVHWNGCKHDELHMAKNELQLGEA